MVREVLVANPQSAKSQSVLSALNDRWDPMPEYMMDEIMAGKDSLGNKEIMEVQTRGYKHLRDIAYGKLAGSYMRDTTDLTAHDSLVTLLQNESRLGAKYGLALDYLKRRDTTLMDSELDNIPGEFDLTDRDLHEYEEYLTYTGILLHLKYDTVHGQYPDSTQIATLFVLADSSDNLPSVYARNLLISLGLLNLSDPVYFPVTLNSGYAGKWPFTETDYPKESSLDVFPNPAGDYFIVEFAIAHSYEQAVITIHDMKGKTVANYKLNGNQNQLVLPTRSLNNAIYMVTLYIDNKPVDTRKITILK